MTERHYLSAHQSHHFIILEKNVFHIIKDKEGICFFILKTRILTDDFMLALNIKRSGIKISLIKQSFEHFFPSTRIDLLLTDYGIFFLDMTLDLMISIFPVKLKGNFALNHIFEKPFPLQLR